MPILSTDGEIRALLCGARTIAVVGMSDNPARDSYRVGRYLREAGYTVIPVNPLVQSTDGTNAVPDLDHLSAPPDIIDVFRRPEFLPEIVEAAIRIGTNALWLQYNTFHEGAVAQASSAGLQVVCDRCIMVEHRHLVQ
jgi:predicted CoA-binding protein